MVIKIAFERSKTFHYNPKRHPFPNQITKPSRGLKKKLTVLNNNKWSNLNRMMNRKLYTQWFGNSRFILLVNVDKLDKYRLNHYNQRFLIPLGFHMVTVKHKDACSVFNSMGLQSLSNVLKSSHCISTPIIYAYGNELSPIGNLESLGIIQKVIKEFHENKKRKPSNYILGGAMDRQLLHRSQLISILGRNNESFMELNSLLMNCVANVSSILQMRQMEIVNGLQFYLDRSQEQNVDENQVNNEEITMENVGFNG